MLPLIVIRFVDTHPSDVSELSFLGSKVKFGTGPIRIPLEYALAVSPAILLSPLLLARARHLD